MKKLTIGITHYNEPWQVVKPLFDSIQMQRGVSLDDIEVVLVNDGEEGVLDETLFKDYSFEIRHFINPKKTVSAARNRCINEALGEYIELCDCDDAYYNCTAFWILFREMNIGFDGLVSNFIEEGKNPQTGEWMYIPHEQPDSTFCHGKVYRTAYLRDNNIYFDDELSIHEDSRFNILAQNCSQNIKFCPMPFYIWQWQDNSVCRRDPKYILKTYQNMLWSNTSLIHEFQKRGMVEKAAQFVVFMVWDAYYSLCSKQWKDINNAEYRQTVEKEFRKYMKEFGTLWDSVKEQDKMVISNGVRQRVIMEGVLELEDITMTDFLKKMRTE